MPLTIGSAAPRTWSCARAEPQAIIAVKSTDENRCLIAQLEPSAPSTATRLRNAAVEGYEYLAETVLGFVLAALMYGPTLVLWCVLLSALAFLAWRLHARIASRAERVL